MMTALPVFLCLPLSLSLSLTVPDTFLSPPSLSLFSVLIVFCSFLPSPPLPPPPSPAYISLKSAVTAETGGLITAPHLTGTPLLSVSLFRGGGSHDSCTLDRRRKRITASEIKVGKDNTHAHMCFLPPISLSPTQTVSPSLPLDIFEVFPSGPKSSKQQLLFVFFWLWMIY